MAGELERLAFDTAQRGLEKQDEVLRDLRARTGTLLAASSIAASFLGARALEGDNSTALTVLALVAFAVTVGASVFILVPRKDRFVFSLAGSRVYEALYEIRADIAEVHRLLAYQLDRFWDDNDAEMTNLFAAYRIAAAALVLEVLFLAVPVTDILD